LDLVPLLRRPRDGVSARRIRDRARLGVVAGDVASRGGTRPWRAGRHPELRAAPRLLRVGTGHRRARRAPHPDRARALRAGPIRSCRDGGHRGGARVVRGRPGRIRRLTHRRPDVLRAGGRRDGRAMGHRLDPRQRRGGPRADGAARTRRARGRRVRRRLRESNGAPGDRAAAPGPARRPRPAEQRAPNAAGVAPAGGAVLARGGALARAVVVRDRRGVADRDDRRRRGRLLGRARRAGPDDIVGYLERLRTRGLRPASVARRISALRGLYKHLVREGELRRDPTENLEAPRRTRSLPRTLSREVVAALVESPDLNEPRGVRDRSVLELLYATGMRASECLGLTLDDVNLSAGYVVCTGKGRKQRLVPVGAEAARW